MFIDFIKHLCVIQHTSIFLNLILDYNFPYYETFKYFRGRVFSQKIALSSDTNVEFRYFIAVVCQSNSVKNSGRTLIIRRWETHMTPRLIKKDSKQYLLLKLKN